MLRRLLMALLIACLSVPALAWPSAHAPSAEYVQDAAPCAGHDAPVRQHGAPFTPMTHHDCIGCIVPQAPASALATPMPLGLDRLIPAPDGGVPGHGAAPETPPPRS